jgi:hypothetical protein
MVAVLYGPAAQNITTRAALKTLLTANNPGENRNRAHQWCARRVGTRGSQVLEV